MKLLFVRARYLVLLLPLFALVSTAQVGCGTANDEFSREDQKIGAGRNGNGYGYGYDDGYGYDGYE